MASVTVLLNPAQSDAGTFTASNAVGGADPSNLKDQRPRLLYQSTTATPFVVIDAGSARAWDSLFLGYFNGQSADTIRLRGATSEANLTAAPGYDSNTLHPSGVPYWPTGSNLSPYRYPHRLFLFTPGGSYQWWRVDFGWGANTDGYVRGGRLVLATAIAPVTSVGDGWESSHSEPVVETVDIGGGQTARTRGSRRRLTARWRDGALTRAEAAAIQQALLQRGSSLDVVFCVDTSDTVDPMQALVVGRVREEVVVTQVPVQYRALGLAVTELALTEMRG